MEYEELTQEQRGIVKTMYVTTEDRNGSDTINPKLEDIIDYYNDNQACFEDNFRVGCEQDNYRWILLKVFKGDQNRFGVWLESGEPRNEDGTVKCD